MCLLGNKLSEGAASFTQDAASFTVTEQKRTKWDKGYYEQRLSITVTGLIVLLFGLKNNQSICIYFKLPLFLLFLLP